MSRAALWVLLVGLLFDTASHAQVLVPEGEDLTEYRETAGRPAETISAVAFTPDGKFVVIGSSQGTSIWDLATGRELRRLEPYGTMIQTLAISPDGKLVATGTEGQGHLWDLVSGIELARLKGHGSMVQSVVFAASGQRVATAARDGILLGTAPRSCGTPPPANSCGS